MSSVQPVFIDVTSVQAQTLPYTNNFEVLDTAFHFHSRYTNDTTAWKNGATGGTSSSLCLRSNYVTHTDGTAPELFFTSVRLSLTAGNMYHVSFKSMAQYNNRRKVLVGINTVRDRDGSTLIEDFGTITSTSSYQAYATDFSVSTSGIYYLIYYGESLTSSKICKWYTDEFNISLVSTPPTATLTGPANSGWYDPGQTVYFTATATDAESNISKIEFYSDDTKVAEDATPSSGVYAATWVPENGGAHTLTAKAVDSYGLTGTSSSRTINVRYLPIATITNLEYHGDYCESNQPVTATATDNDGTIQYVVFYRGTDSIGIDSTSPYQMVVPLVYDEFNSSIAIVAKAVDDDGLEGIATVPINILPNPCTLTTPNELLKQTICSGDSVSMSTESGGASPQTVRWLKKEGEGAWAAISGATSHRYKAKQAALYMAEWTHENMAVCTTAVDTVKMPYIISDTLVYYQGKSAIVTTRTENGTSPYTYTWSTGTCKNDNCDTILIDDFSNWIWVEVQDDAGCIVRDTLSLEIACNSQQFGLENLDSLVGDVAEFKSNQEQAFQDFIGSEKSLDSTSLQKAAEGIASDKIIIPVVFFIANNDSLPDSSSAYDLPVNGIRDLFTNYPELIERQIDTVNVYLSKVPIQVGGVSKTFKLCRATRDTSGATIPLFYQDSLQLLPLNKGDLLYKKHPNITPDRYLRIAVGVGAGKSWGYLASSVHYNPDKRDGIGIELGYFGPVNSKHVYPGLKINGNNSTGASLLHELGHYLDLLHPFQPSEDWGHYNDPVNTCFAFLAEDSGKYYQNFAVNDSTNQAVAQWDFVRDTPPQSKRMNPTKSCGQQPVGQYLCNLYSYASGEMEKMVANAMSGSPNSCVHNFYSGKSLTQGQLERMYYAVQYYRPKLVSPENLIKTGVACSEPLAQFQYDRNYVCGTGNKSKIVLTPLDNQVAGYTYEWNVTGATATIYPDTGGAVPTTFTFDTEKDTIATITLTVSDNQPIPKVRTTTVKVYIKSTCGGLELYKKNMFFGTHAGLSWHSTGASFFPAPNLGSYNASGTRITSTGGSVTYNNPLNGKMKFYASGKNIWNASHQKLTGVTINSDEATSQYGIALPTPGDTSRVWLFTVPNGDSSTFGSSGLRWHKVKQSYLADSSVWNQVVPYISGSSAGGSAKVAEKITAISKTGCADDGYWLICQGGKGTATGSKFLVYSVTTSGLSTPVQYSARYQSKTGFIKPSPLGDKLMITYSDLDSNYSGFGVGKNARVYTFDKTTGVIDTTHAKELRIPNLPSGVSTVSTYGCTFSPDGSKAYINVNEKHIKTGSNATLAYKVTTGIYQFDLNTDSTNITGKLIDRIPSGTNPSLNLMTGSDGKIYISNTLDVSIQKQFKDRSLDINYLNAKAESARKLGVIHFPNKSDVACGLSWEGPDLITQTSQYILSSGGLANFLESNVETIVPSHGLTNTDPKDLGVNPIPCCGNQTEIQNIACTDNTNGTNGKDFYYTFTIDSLYGSTYPEVTIKTCGSDFEVNTRVKIKNNLGAWVTLQSGLNQITQTSCSTGDGHVVEIGNLTDNILAFPSGGFTNPYEFLIEVEAQSPTVTGNFKTEIIIIEDYGDSDPPLSCCRLAVDGSKEEPKGNTQISKKAPGMNLFPNPAKDRLNIQLQGLQKEAFLTITDALGREVSQLKIVDKIELDVHSLSKGIYRVRARDNIHSIVKTLVIE